MYVCLCNAVKESEIVSSVRNGNEDLDSVSVELGVGMCCGSCVQMAKTLIEVTRKEKQVGSGVQIAHIRNDCDSSQ